MSEQRWAQARAVAARLDARAALPKAALSTALQDYGRYLQGGGQESFAAFLVHRRLIGPSQARELDLAEPLAPTPPSRHTPPSRYTPQSGSARRRGRGGVTIPGFEIGEVLGKGGMGIVYRAKDSGGRAVALKLLLRGRSTTAERRFARERKALKRLDHPGIVRIYEAGESEHGPWISMELVEGGTLQDALRDGGLAPSRALDVVVDAAEALGHAHAQGLLHRDIKPSNIMIDAEGRGRLMDFGLTKDLEQESLLTQAEAVLGTPHYLSPEQAAGRNDAISARSDVFGLGVVLYQVLTGRLPFEARTSPELMARIATHEPPEPRARRGSIPKALSRACMKALRKRPADRYEDAGALARDLSRIRSGEEVRIDGPARRLALFLRRHPWIAAAVAALALALAAAPLAAPAVERWRASRRREQRAAELRAAIIEASKALKAAGEGPELDSRLEALLTAVREAEGLLAQEPEPELAAVLGSPKLGRQLNRALLRRADRRSSVDLAGALADLKTTAERGGPEAAEARLLAASLERERGRSEAALVWLSEGLTGDRRAALARAACLDALGRSGEAAEALRPFVGEEAGLSERLALAGYLDRAGEADAADAIFEAAERRRPGEPSILVARAESLARRGAVDEALRVLDSARTETRRRQLGLLRVDLLRRADRLDEAAAAARQVMEDDGGAEAALAFAELGYLRGLPADLERGLERASRDPEPRFQVAAETWRVRLLMLRGRRDQALAAARALVSRAPEAADPRALLASLLTVPEEREAALRRCLELASIRAWALEQLGLLLAQRGDGQGALALAERLAETPGAELRALWLRATALVTQGRRRESEEVFARYTDRRHQEVRAGRGLVGRARRLLAFPDRGARAQAASLLTAALDEGARDCETLRLVSRSGLDKPEQAFALRLRAARANPCCLEAALDALAVPTLPLKDALSLADQALRLGPSEAEAARIYGARFRALLRGRRLREAEVALASLEERRGRPDELARAELARARGDRAAEARARAEQRALQDRLRDRLTELQGLLRRPGSDINNPIVTPKIRRIKAILSELSELGLDEETLAPFRAKATILESNGFVSSLHKAATVMTAPASLISYIDDVYDARFFLGDRGIEVYIEDPARDIQLPAARRAFCQATYNVVELAAPRGPIDREALARRVLRDAEACLAEEPRAITAYVFRAYAYAVLGQSARARFDEELLGAGGARTVSFFRMLRAIAERRPLDAARHAREAIALGLNPRSLASHPMIAPVRERPEFRELLGE